MNYKTLFFSLLIFIKLNASNRIDIYLSFNDCMNCYAHISALQSINGYEKNIIICKEDSAVSKELLENFAIPENINYIFINRKMPAYSLCKIFVKDQLLDSFPLTALTEKTKMLNDYALKTMGANIRTYFLPNATTLTKERIQLSVKGNHISVYDYILGKNIIFLIDKNNDTLKKILELKGSQFSQRTFLKLANLDTSFYNSCFEDLKKYGKAHAHLEQAFLSDSSAFILLNFPWVRLKEKNSKDTVLDVSVFLYENNFITGKKQLSLINAAAMKNKFKGRYDLNSSFPFFADASGKLTMSLLDFGRANNETYMLGDFTKQTSNDFLFEDLSQKFAAGYLTKTKTDSFAIHSNARFYFSIKLKMIIDHEKNKIITLNNYELPATSFCADILSKGDTLKLLVLHKNEIEIVSYDLKAQKAIRGNRFVLPENCFVNSLRFYNSQTIAFFDIASTGLSIMNVD